MVACGTGPSFNLSQVETARQKGFALAGVNLLYQFVPDLRVLFATNESFWDYYPEARECSAEKWTNSKDAAKKYGLNYIDSRNEKGLSDDPTIIHHGHSSGYCLINVLYLLGFTRIILLGYDMKFAPDYRGQDKKIGSSPRHFFGEYKPQCQHWPYFSVKNGVHVELTSLYRTIAEQNRVEIINCTPDSALDCFPMMDIADVR